MEELYYWNGDKKKSYSWKGLLFLFHKLIDGSSSNLWGYHGGKHYLIESFFKNFRHNDNDGIYKEGSWHQKSWKELIQLKDEDGRLTSTWEWVWKWGEWYWVEPTFTPKKYQVTDNFGRIIPSSLIKQAYLAFNFPEETKVKRSPYHRGWWRTRNCNRWTFRFDPVPFIGGKRNGWWHKYAGKHAGRAAKKRAWYAHDVDKKEYLLEYGITYKMDDKEFCHNHGNGGKGKGWKRTRVRKQWMRKLV